MNVAEIKMLRWVRGKTKNDKIKNVNIRNIIEITQLKIS